MSATTEEKIERLLGQLSQMQFIAENAKNDLVLMRSFGQYIEIQQAKERLEKAEKFITLVKDQLKEIDPDIVFPSFPRW